MADSTLRPGLGDALEFPKVSATQVDKPAIERLHPAKKLHATVLDYLLKRLTWSETRMKTFHARWHMAEMQHQAYLNLSDYEKTLKSMRTGGQPPQITSIVVPYAFATVNTTVTYHINAFAGRKPMFTLTANKKDSMIAVPAQELMLQHNADHTGLVRQTYDWLYSGQIYGVGVFKNLWKTETALRSSFKESSPLQQAVGITGKVRSREPRIVYEGNDVSCVDPFMFFPDTNVPFVDLSKKGEFVVFRAYPGKHALLTLEAQGVLKYVNQAGTLPADSQDFSNRFQGLSDFSPKQGARSDVSNIVQEDTFCIRLIPAEVGLGQSRYPEMWLFTVLNKKIIAQAVQLDFDHNQLPVSCHEPYSVGYGFGNHSLVDFLSPMQDAMSWLINSHIYNVRQTQNNMFIVDPSRIEIEDLKNPKPGKLIRLKPQAIGQDVRTAIQQLNTHDVTANNVADFSLFMRLGDAILGVNDNARGLSEANASRKTATEVRTALEAGTSRLASQARLISAQGFIPLAQQMSMNIGQYMTQEYAFKVLGSDGEKIVNIDPSMVVGDFVFPVHDGTLPVDKVAMLGVWKEILMGLAQQPQLAANFDIVKVFEYVAELGGARDISRFKTQQAAMPPVPGAEVLPDDAVAAGAAAGNLVPVSELMNG